MANPIVPQGTLNRLRASITLNDFTNLNITASYLGKEGISMTFSGEATTPLPQMTGVVQSPEPYQMVSIMAHLIKSQALANAYKTQFETNTLMGDVTVRPDVPSGVGLGPYQISNVALMNPGSLKFDGTDANFTVTFSGIYYINSELWSS